MNFLLSPLLAVLGFLTTSTFGMQNPERHFGCPPGKNVCIYPIDEAVIQCETTLDFQVAVHIPENQTIQANWRHSMDIKLSMPSGDVLTPENVFNLKTPELRSWKLKVFEDSADETPEGFMSYAVVFRNVKFTPRFGKGPVTVTVFSRGVKTEVKYTLREPTKRRAKNVILFVGDGMALPMMAAARLVSRGMVHGKYKDYLHMEKMPYFGLQNPAGVDSIITDSANSASSFNTGHKSSVNALGVYADSSEDNFGHPKHETLAEHIKREFGMSIGVVTTAEVQDATPAAVWSHTRRRAEKAVITSQAINGCDDCTTVVAPDVLMGGGGKYFLPENSIDGSNMYKNYSAAGYTVTHTRKEMLAAANDSATKKLLTISHYGNMEVWLDRNVYKESMNDTENSPTGDGVAPTDQPNMDEMVRAALKILSKNENGFYLMVEAASIDKSAHPLDIPRVLSDLIELDNTVGMVKEWAKARLEDDTLVIATADHGHGFDVFGTVDTHIYDRAVRASEEKPVLDVKNLCKGVTDNAGKFFRRFNDPVTDRPVREVNIARRLSVGVYSRAGYPDYKDSDGDGFPDTWNVRTTLAAGMNNFPDHSEDYKVSKKMKKPAVKRGSVYLDNPEDDVNGIFMSGNLPPSSSTGVHTMQDVGIFAMGPGAERVHGIMDNTEVYHIMAEALGVGTDGTFDKEQHLYGDLVKCVNDKNKCHCEKVNRTTKCACKQFGPKMVFVMPSMKMCSKVNGIPM